MFLHKIHVEIVTQPGVTQLRKIHFRCFCVLKIHVEIVTQPGVTQTPKNCLEFTFFRGDQENSFYLQNRKIDWVFYCSGMTWLVRKLDSGRSQWTSSDHERSNGRFYKCQQCEGKYGVFYQKIYFFEIRFTWHKFFDLSSVVFFIQRNCWKENGQRLRQTLNWKW